MKRPVTTGLPWAIWTVALTVATAGIVLLVLAGTSPAGAYGFPGSAAIFVLTFGGVGAVVASRAPSNPIGWLFCWMGIGSAVQFLGREYEAYSLVVHHGAAGSGVYGAWLDSWIWLPATIGMLPLLLLFFPNGRLQSPRWRALVWVVAISLPLASLSAAFAPGPLENAKLTNPLGLHGAPGRLAAALNVAIIVVQLTLLPAVAAFVLRFRRARGVEREQLKWLAGAALFAALSFVLFFASQKAPRFVKLTESLTIIAIGTIPIAVGIAILRYRLYDIDRIISRTVSYALLSAVLIGAYVGLVVGLESITRPLTGRSDFAVAASTLIVAALFVPLRRRVQNVVDRRFNRHRYDAATTIEAFTARLRAEVDIDTLAVELKDIVARTMQPSVVSVWLREAP